MNDIRVLLVDDNPVNLELVSFVLRHAGLTCDCATGADEALACIGVQRPDLVLMDMQMPGIDGLVLTQQLKADPATRAIVVVAFTAFAMKGDEARLLAAGCDGYLSKPIDVASFADSVRSFVKPAGAGAGSAG